MALSADDCEELLALAIADATGSDDPDILENALREVVSSGFDQSRTIYQDANSLLRQMRSSGEAGDMVGDATSSDSSDDEQGADEPGSNGDFETPNPPHVDSSTSNRWAKALDPRHNYPYYYHVDSHVSTWARPDGYASEDDAANPVTREEMAPPKNLWARTFSNEHSTEFFYHVGTLETTWDRPDGYTTDEDAAVVAPGNPEPPLKKVKEHWVKSRDEEHDMDYYYNEETGQSVWKRPSGYSSDNEADDDGANPHKVNLSPPKNRWALAFDTKYQRSYWYHVDTHENTWDRPDGYSTDEDAGVGEFFQNSQRAPPTQEVEKEAEVPPQATEEEFPNIETVIPYKEDEESDGTKNDDGALAYLERSDSVAAIIAAHNMQKHVNLWLASVGDLPHAASQSLEPSAANNSTSSTQDIVDFPDVDSHTPHVPVEGEGATDDIPGLARHDSVTAIVTKNLMLKHAASWMALARNAKKSSDSNMESESENPSEGEDFPDIESHTAYQAESSNTDAKQSEEIASLLRTDSVSAIITKHMLLKHANSWVQAVKSATDSKAKDLGPKTEVIDRDDSESFTSRGVLEEPGTTEEPALNGSEHEDHSDFHGSVGASNKSRLGAAAALWILHSAAVTIQKLVRAWKAWKQYQTLQQRIRAAVLLQAVERARQARVKREELHAINTAAEREKLAAEREKLAAERKRLADKQAAEERELLAAKQATEEREREVAKEAAEERARLAEEREQIAEERRLMAAERQQLTTEKEEFSAMKAAAEREQLEAKRAAEERERLARLAARQHQNARQIQKIVRGRQARQRYNALREKRRQQREQLAALRREFEEGLRQDELRAEAARRVQAQARRRAAQKRKQQLLEEQNKRTKAAITIQCAQRRHAAQREVARRRLSHTRLRHESSMAQYRQVLESVTESYIRTLGDEVRQCVTTAQVAADAELTRFGQEKIDALIQKTLVVAGHVAERENEERQRGKSTSAAIKHQRRRVLDLAKEALKQSHRAAKAAHKAVEAAVRANRTLHKLEERRKDEEEALSDALTFMADALAGEAAVAPDSAHSRAVANQVESEARDQRAAQRGHRAALARAALFWQLRDRHEQLGYISSGLEHDDELYDTYGAEIDLHQKTEVGYLVNQVFREEEHETRDKTNESLTNRSAASEFDARLEPVGGSKVDVADIDRDVEELLAGQGDDQHGFKTKNRKKSHKKKRAPKAGAEQQKVKRRERKQAREKSKKNMKAVASTYGNAKEFKAMRAELLAKSPRKSKRASTKKKSRGSGRSHHGNASQSKSSKRHSDVHTHEEEKEGNSKESSYEPVKAEEKRVPPPPVKKWRRYKDPISGFPYWYHEATDESVWEAPRNYQPGVNNDENHVTSRYRPSEPPPQNRWAKAHDPRYETAFWYNVDTHESTWMRPDGYTTETDAGSHDSNDESDDGHEHHYHQPPDDRPPDDDLAVYFQKRLIAVANPTKPQEWKVSTRGSIESKEDAPVAGSGKAAVASLRQQVHGDDESEQGRYDSGIIDMEV